MDATIADVQAMLQHLFASEHMFCVEQSAGVLLVAVHQAGVPCVMFRCNITGGKAVSCTRLRGHCNTYKRIVACIATYLNADAYLPAGSLPIRPAPRFTADDDATLADVVRHLQLPHASVWEATCALAMLLQPPYDTHMAAATVAPDVCHIWSHIVHHGVLRPRNLDIAAQAALCLLGALQCGSTHASLLLPHMLRHVVPRMEAAIQAGEVAVTQPYLDAYADDSENDDDDDDGMRLAHTHSVLALYAQVLVCVDIVCFLMDQRLDV